MSFQFQPLQMALLSMMRATLWRKLPQTPIETKTASSFRLKADQGANGA